MTLTPQSTYSLWRLVTSTNAFSGNVDRNVVDVMSDDAALRHGQKVTGKITIETTQQKTDNYEQKPFPVGGPSEPSNYL